MTKCCPHKASQEVRGRWKSRTNELQGSGWRICSSVTEQATKDVLTTAKCLEDAFLVSAPHSTRPVYCQRVTEKTMLLCHACNTVAGTSLADLATMCLGESLSSRKLPRPGCNNHPEIIIPVGPQQWRNKPNTGSLREANEKKERGPKLGLLD